MQHMLICESPTFEFFFEERFLEIVVVHDTLRYIHFVKNVIFGLRCEKPSKIG